MKGYTSRINRRFEFGSNQSEGRQLDQKAFSVLIRLAAMAFTLLMLVTGHLGSKLEKLLDFFHLFIIYLFCAVW